ncbi:MAG: hypothetical protein RBT25_02940 [Lentisphaeria bacterium]|nr:hypothetical protein [Lentisphaeria bacterium]
MCTMAAYVGEQKAAPLLLRMLEAQEGFDSGHYSGIATMHEGKIYLAKVCGDCQRLRRHTEAENLPGNVGIAHSRTPGIALDSWSQPFLAADQKVVYCANGGAGRFKATNDYQKYYDLLLQAGCEFSTECEHEVQGYPLMSNGHGVHSSDLFANLLSHVHAQGKSLPHSLYETFTCLPAEIASLALSLEEPGMVSALRLNLPLLWGRKDNAFYLATSALAFVGEGIDWVNPVPRASCMSMSAENISFIPMDRFSDLLLPQPPRGRVREALDAMFAEGQRHKFSALRIAVRKLALWPENKVQETNMEVYEYLREKLFSGELCMTADSAPASRPGDLAPVTYFSRR